MSKPLLAAFMSVCALAVPTVGHAKLTQSPRECEMSVGPSRMMFSAFQANKTDEIFCRHIPERGQTALIIDAKESELRDMVVEVFLVRDVGQKAWNDDIDANLVAHSDPKAYFARSGTMIFEHDFKQDGPYLAVVRAVGENGAKEYVGIYPFSVGETNGWFGASAVLAAACGMVWFSLRRRAEQGLTPAGPTRGGRPNQPQNDPAHAGPHDGASPTNPV